MLKEIAGWGSIGFAGLAAACGIYSGLFIEVRDSVDHFIGDLQRQSQWTSWAAAAAGIAVGLQALEKYLK
jgi:hypothetical protein